MSEDAPVNTGAVEWPDSGSAYFAVRSMQTKLHRWAGEDPSRRFGDLFNLVYDPAFLVEAWQRVSTNKGAKTAGVDKVTAAWVETVIGVRVFLGQIRDSLKSGGFRPNTRDFRCFVLPGVLWSWCSVRALESVSIWCVVMVLARVSRRGWRAVPRAAVVPPS